MKGRHYVCAVAVSVAIGFSGSASAECWAQACLGYVDQLYIEADDGLWLQTSGDERLANCTADSGVYLRLPGTASKFKETYALLLTAQVIGAQVVVRIHEGTNPCRIAYVYMNRQSQ